MAAFLDGRLSWRGIADVVGEVLEGHEPGKVSTIEEVVESDGRARRQRRRGRGPEERCVKSPTPEELADSQVADQPAAGDQRAPGGASPPLLLLAGVVLLAFVRPRMAGTIGVLAAIIAMIMLHELGHFVMAKRAGMKVTEFFLGFGPRLWSFRRGETEYGVKAIPAGGLRPHHRDEQRRRGRPRRRGAHLPVEALPPPPRRGGGRLHDALHHRRLPAVPALRRRRPARRRGRWWSRSSPARRPRQGGFQVGDRIVAVNGNPVKEWEEIPRYVQSHGEGQLEFTVVRKGTGERLTISVRPRKTVVDGVEAPRVGHRARARTSSGSRSRRPSARP